MSQLSTLWRVTAVAVFANGVFLGQSPLTLSTVSPPAAAPLSPSSGGSLSGLDWRRLGRSSFDVQLAGPATGPVSSVWYSSTGGRLFARTSAGRTFETADFEHWSPSESNRLEVPIPINPKVTPELHARVMNLPGDTRRTWSLGHSLLVSPDGGSSWTNLADAAGQPVIGTGQQDVAVNPFDPDSIAVANDFGVWQSHDGGRSWAGLNEDLPNLPIARILSMRRGLLRIALADGTSLALSDPRSSWTARGGDNSLALEIRDRQRLTKLLGAEITALGRGGDFAYAGSSDGRVWMSRDRGTTWNLPQSVSRNSIERFYVDPENARAALAVISSPAIPNAPPSPRLVRTVNAGAVWDDITGNLADTPIHAATADRSSSTAYLATDRGVYMARVDLNNFAPPSAWVAITGTLPREKLTDISFDPAASQLYAAVEGFGLYTAPAPVRSGTLRLSNAADFSTRPAAPGSVISVIGGKLTRASAGDLNFPVLAADENESQLQVPFEARAPGVDLSIEGPGRTAALALSIRNVSPSIFIDRDGAPFLVDAETGLTLDAAAVAHPRAHLQLLATGLGRVQPDWPTGTPAPAEHPPTVVAPLQAYLDSVPLEVTKATLAPGYVGYYLVEVRLPALLNAGTAELYLIGDGQESNRVRIAVEAE